MSHIPSTAAVALRPEQPDASGAAAPSRRARRERRAAQDALGMPVELPLVPGETPAPLEIGHIPSRVSPPTEQPTAKMPSAAFERRPATPTAAPAPQPRRIEDGPRNVGPSRAGVCAPLPSRRQRREAARRDAGDAPPPKARDDVIPVPPPGSFSTVEMPIVDGFDNAPKPIDPAEARRRKRFGRSQRPHDQIDAYAATEATRPPETGDDVGLADTAVGIPVATNVPRAPEPQARLLAEAPPSDELFPTPYDSSRSARRALARDDAESGGAPTAAQRLAAAPATALGLIRRIPGAIQATPSLILRVAGLVRRVPAALRSVPGRLVLIPGLLAAFPAWTLARLAGGLRAVRRRPIVVMRPVVVTAVVAAMCVAIALGGTRAALAPDIAPGAQLLAVGPAVADRVETASSRSSVVRASTSDRIEGVEITSASNSSVSIAWANPAMTAGDVITVRRTEGETVANSADDGVAVALTSANSIALVDRDLPENAAFTYSFFIARDGGEPLFSNAVVARTRALSNTLTPGDVLTPGQRLLSDNGQFDLFMSSAGDLQLRDHKGNVLWWSGTESAGAQLEMLENGDLALTLGGSIVWETATAGHPGAALTLRDDGDIALVVDGETIWSRHELGNMVRGDDYPWPRAGYGYSELRYSYRNCTDFVAWRLNVQAGVYGPPWKYTWANLTPRGGNAREWAQYYTDRTDQTPTLGSVAWWDGKNFGSGLGHVAIVSAVWPDGSITVEEYMGSGSRAYSIRHLYPDGAPGTSAWPNSFLHIHDIQ